MGVILLPGREEKIFNLHATYTGLPWLVKVFQIEAGKKGQSSLQHFRVCFFMIFSVLWNNNFGVPVLPTR